MSRGDDQEGVPDKHISEDMGEPKQELLCVRILCCPFRLLFGVLGCMATCLCLPFLLCCQVGTVAVIMCCCNPSLKSLEKLYRSPLWVVVLRDQHKLDREVYSICTAIFSHPDFEREALRLFERADTDSSGFVDTGELNDLLHGMPCSVALTEVDFADINKLYMRYTGRKTRLTRDEFPVFLKCVFAMVVANAILVQRMGRAEIVVVGIDGSGRARDVEKQAASIREIVEE